MQTTRKMKPAVRRLIFYSIGILLICVGIYIYDQHTTGKIGNSNFFSTSTSASVSGNTILRLAGSHTMGQTLVPALAKSYMEKNGYSNVQVFNNNVITGTKNGATDKIEINQDGNTSNAISLVNNNSIDICMSSCEEVGLIEHVIGIDGIVVIVNKNSSISNLSIDKLSEIYSGKSMNTYCREKTSGMYIVFEDECMDGKPMSNSVKYLNSDIEILNAVANDPNGIGIVNYTLINNTSVKSIPISEVDGTPPVIANTSTIESERYPLTRELYFYNKNVTPAITDFIRFIESSDGQKVVSNVGFVNMIIRFNNKRENPESLPGDPASYTALINNDEMITTEFRFETGSQHLDARGLEDIIRLVSFLGQSENRNRRVILVGFTDSVGDQASNVALSLRRAKSLADILIASGIQVKSTLGYGAIRPVRSNDTESDRAENRRVEVWLEK